MDRDFSLIALRIVRRRAFSDACRCLVPAVDASAAEAESQAVGVRRWSSAVRSAASTASTADGVVRSAAAETVSSGGDIPADGDRSRPVPSDGERSRDPAGDADDGELLRRLAGGR